MAISEAARSDLYTVLRKVIGPDPAETLMTVFPRYETDQVATKGDVALLKGDLAVLRAEFKTDIAELRAEIAGLVASVHKTMAIWSLTILVTVIGAMVGLLSLN